VRADRDRLMQVFVNLLSNAVKFVPAGNGRVHVSARLDGGEWRASVADNGPGIPAGDRERIFDRFVQTRLDGTRSGTGLGLAISRRIVAHFGGRITAETPAKKGALFVLALPATAALRARPAPLIGPGSAAQADAAPAAR
jgi:signal transduction histidine kinase